MEKINLATPKLEVHLLTVAQQMGHMNLTVKNKTKPNNKRKAQEHLSAEALGLLRPKPGVSDHAEQVWSCFCVSRPYCDGSKRGAEPAPT